MEAVDINKLKAEGWSHLASFVKLEDGHWGLTRTAPIEDLSMIGLVSIVYCQDCAIPHNKWTGCPKMNGLVPPPNHFCSYGERKTRGAD